MVICFVRAALLLVCALVMALGADLSEIQPRLLLTPQRLKRLRRDQERQTDRWQAFENQVKTVADSPERGFELGLYYAITGDAGRGREAIAWALKNVSTPGTKRQIALVADWCTTLLSTEDKAGLLISKGTAEGAPGMRDTLFLAIAAGNEAAETATTNWEPVLQDFVDHATWTKPDQLYALCEYIDAMQNVLHSNLRSDAVLFFSKLPAAVLLSMKPSAMAHVGWQQRAAALALVNLDPNLVDSQFLQSWAMEEGAAEQHGPGVAYELLWGNPYLPGVSYQNLDPWAYDENGHLFARTDWTDKACWIAIGPNATESENCAANWMHEEFRAKQLRLIPLLEKCFAVEHPVMTEPALIWNRYPGGGVTYNYNRKALPGAADRAGLFLLTTPVSGKVCIQNSK